MPATVVVGTQWGDEGKGKFTDLVAKEMHLVVRYQPQVDVASGAVRGGEALVRWDHPRLGLLDPGEFLPIVEEHGMTMALRACVFVAAP